MKIHKPWFCRSFFIPHPSNLNTMPVKSFNPTSPARRQMTVIKNPDDESGSDPSAFSITGGERANPVLSALSPPGGSQAVKPTTAPVWMTSST